MPSLIHKLWSTRKQNRSIREKGMVDNGEKMVTEKYGCKDALKPSLHEAQARVRQNGGKRE